MKLLTSSTLQLLMGGRSDPFTLEDGRAAAGVTTPAGATGSGMAGSIATGNGSARGIESGEDTGIADSTGIVIDGTSVGAACMGRDSDIACRASVCIFSSAIASSSLSTNAMASTPTIPPIPKPLVSPVPPTPPMPFFACLAHPGEQ